MKNILLAALATIAAQPLIYLIWFFVPLIIEGLPVRQLFRGMFEMIPLVMVFASVIVPIVGIPIFLAFRKFNKATTLNLMFTGLLITTIPVLIFGLPIDDPGSGSAYGGHWHGAGFVDFMLDGVHTKYAWYRFIEQIIGFGMHGLIGAYIFLRVWQRYEKP